MNKIPKKIHPEYFQKILDGDKTYELRLSDFEIRQGDILVLKEWDPNTENYTGRELEKTVGYVGKFKTADLFWSEEEVKDKGLQIISLK